MSKKVTDLPVGSANGADLYAASGGTDTRVTGGGANGVATLDSTSKVPNVQLHLGENGGPAGPIDSTGKIPSGQLPPLQHDIGEAADEAAMLALSVAAPAMALRTDFTPAHIFMLTADPASDISNWHDTGELGAGAADPSAKVGPNATNGVASTFMRSDAAPAIDLSVNYTWTGGHDFHDGAAFSRVSGSSSPSLLINSSNPQFEIQNTGASANESRWNLTAISDQLVFRALNDAGDVADNAWIMTRSAGTVDAHSFQVGGNPILYLSTGSDITVYEDIHMSEKKIENLAAPTNDKDATNKAYVDGLVNAKTFFATPKCMIKEHTKQVNNPDPVITLFDANIAAPRAGEYSTIEFYFRCDQNGTNTMTFAPDVGPSHDINIIDPTTTFGVFATIFWNGGNLMMQGRQYNADGSEGAAIGFVLTDGFITMNVNYTNSVGAGNAQVENVRCISYVEI